MTYDEAVEFLRAKFELIAENAYTEEFEATVRDFARQMENVFTDPRTTMASLRSLDGSLEAFFLGAYVLDADQPELRRELVERFGASRLQAAPKTVVRRVLKRGEIRDVEEYHQVREFLSNVENIEVVGEENYAILDSIAGTFSGPEENLPERPQRKKRAGEAKSKIRKPFPPFDLRVEVDEKLCPEGTTFETMAEFLSAKSELLAEIVAQPAAAQMLRNVAAQEIEAARGITTREMERGLAFAFVEHQLESAVGFSVSGEKMRGVETELERRFGFRRLGPSAQVQIARLLATGDVPSWRERITVRWFFDTYRNQTLFPRGAGEVLMKRLPPVVEAGPVMTPRPAVAPDESQLQVGAVFQTMWSDRPSRVVAFDEIEVFYDAHGGSEVGWMFGEKRRRLSYYRTVTPLFLDRAEKLRVDPVSAEYRALHRPDLPLRFGRSAAIQWCEELWPTQEALAAHVAAVDPAWLTGPMLHAREVALIPRSLKGAWKPAVLLQAENGVAFTLLELLWHAQRLQRPFATTPNGGIGFYRSGLEKKGVPSFLTGNARHWATDWHAQAPVAPTV